MKKQIATSLIVMLLAFVGAYAINSNGITSVPGIADDDPSVNLIDNSESPLTSHTLIRESTRFTNEDPVARLWRSCNKARQILDSAYEFKESKIGAVGESRHDYKSVIVNQSIKQPVCKIVKKETPQKTDTSVSRPVLKRLKYYVEHKGLNISILDAKKMYTSGEITKREIYDFYYTQG